MITMNVFSDNHYKCNLPIVGSEGEEPVGQNPVVGESDPGNLTGNKYHQWFWQWWWWWWWWWWRWFVLRFTHRLLLNVGDRAVKSCRAAWLWNCAESPLVIVIDIIAMMRDLGLEAAFFIAQNLAFYRNTFTLTKLTKGSQETKTAVICPFTPFEENQPYFTRLHLTNIWSHVFTLCQWGPLTFQGDSLLVYIQTILQESSSKGPNVNYGSWLMMKVMTWYCRWHV